MLAVFAKAPQYEYAHEKEKLSTIVQKFSNDKACTLLKQQEGTSVGK